MMTDFFIHFLACNILISGMILLLFFIKKLLKKSLTKRTQYHLWFPLLILLAVPFLPFRASSLLSRLFDFLCIEDRFFSNDYLKILPGNASQPISGAVGWMNDFAVSAQSQTSSVITTILFCIWLAGIFTMSVFTVRSFLSLRRIRHSALPLQNPDVQVLYQKCLAESCLPSEIPLYSTAFLQTPVITGIFRPAIYLPISVLSDYRLSDIRYILLHELQHYRHKDNLSCYLGVAYSILYWFNPFVWSALKAMRNDREIACDISVLHILDSASYKNYACTLLHFAEKSSVSAFPFSNGLSTDARQLEKRLLAILSHKKTSVFQKAGNLLFFLLIVALFAGSIPVCFSLASDTASYEWNTVIPKEHSVLELSEYFSNVSGSFVLYDLQKKHWTIYHPAKASTRVSPDSTYKIYDALFALEEQIITPETSFLPWDQTTYPFAEWNRDQTLSTAMSASVNWYFQSLDKTLGKRTLQSYIQKIGYGNETIRGSLSSYWMESSLKISPVEQVEQLVALYQNTFHFSSENIQAVKNSIFLTSTSSGSLYGKTGTGRIDGKDTNGWFIGFVESSENTSFFAVNLHSKENATGSAAANIALSILSDLGIWRQ